MTKRELINILAAYPDDMEVKVTCDRHVRPILAVSDIVTMETNVVSIEIVAEDKPDLSAIAHHAAESMHATRYEP